MPEDLLKLIENNYFEDYRKEVESLDQTYIELISYMNNPMQNFIFNEEDIYLESITFLNQFILKNILEYFIKNSQPNYNDFIQIVEKFFSVEENSKKIKDIILKKTKEVYKSLTPEQEEKINEISDKNVQEFTEKGIKQEKLFQKVYEQINKLDPSELKKIFESVIKTEKDKENLIKATDYLNKEIEKRRSVAKEQQYVKNILKTIKQSAEDVKWQTEEEKESENEENNEDNNEDNNEEITISEIFPLLYKHKIIHHTFNILKRQATYLDNFIKDFIDSEIGTSMIGTEKSAEIIASKQDFIACISILICFTLSYNSAIIAYKNENPNETETDGLNEDTILFNALNVIINEEEYFEVLDLVRTALDQTMTFVPTKRIAKIFKFGNRILKQFGINSFVKLTSNPSSFAKMMKQIFMNLKQGSALKNILEVWNINLEHLLVLDKLKISNEVINQAYKEVISDVLKSKSKLNKLLLLIFKENGVEVSKATQAGKAARKLFDKFKPKTAEEKQQGEELNTFTSEVGE